MIVLDINNVSSVKFVMSQLSISQGASKKMKNSMDEIMSVNDNDSNQSNQVNSNSYLPISFRYIFEDFANEIIYEIFFVS